MCKLTDGGQAQGRIHLLRHRCVAGVRRSEDAATSDAATVGAANRAEHAGQAEPEEPAGAALEAVLGGGIARIVFRNAIAARPDDIELRRRFLDALEPYQLPGELGQQFVASGGMHQVLPGS
jgi:hypothetical protein